MIEPSLFPLMLILQGVLGGIDTLLNHELTERLPRNVSARTEVAIHSLRELNYAILFGVVACFVCAGLVAVIAACLLLGEVAITAWDEVVENKTRVLPNSERFLHVFLTLNLGILLASLALGTREASQMTAGLSLREAGVVSLTLAFLALISGAWAVRDFCAWRDLGRRTLNYD